jgi:YVTN family beta-propeller protein
MRPSLIIAVIAPILSACKSETSPGDGNSGTPPNATHPSGIAGAQIIGLAGRPFGIRLTRSGDVLITEQDLNRAVRVDSLGGRAVNVGVGFDPGDVIANSAGTTAFVSGFQDGTLSVVDLATNGVSKTIRVSTSNAYRLALSTDGSKLYVTSGDGYLYTVTTATLSKTDSVPLSASQGIAINHAGTELYVSGTSGTVWRLDLPRLTTGQGASLSCAAQDVALPRDDSELYVACEGGTIAVLDPTTLATKRTITLTGAAPFGLAVTPDDAQIYVASAQTRNLTIIDRASYSVVKTITLTGVPRRIAFNATGTKAYIANEANWVDVIQ